MGKNSFQTAQKNATIMFYLVLFSLPFLVMWDKLVVVPTSKLFPRAIVNENDAGGSVSSGIDRVVSGVKSLIRIFFL